MRDYFLYPAQTNLELYAQAIAGGYSRAERRRLADAYQFALRQVFSLARGSGKPFIAHLVGTASLALASGCPEDWTIAALVHALYQRRVPFQGGLPPETRRNLVAERLGAAVDDIVHRYTSFEAEDLCRLASDSDLGRADVLTLRLADELEDLCGHALALHGDAAADAQGVRGGSTWRRQAKTREAPALLALSQRLGLEGMRRGLTHWLEFSADPEELADMRTGWLSSVDVAAEG